MLGRGPIHDVLHLHLYCICRWMLCFTCILNLCVWLSVHVGIAFPSDKENYLMCPSAFTTCLDGLLATRLSYCRTLYISHSAAALYICLEPKPRKSTNFKAEEAMLVTPCSCTATTLHYSCNVGSPLKTSIWQNNRNVKQI